MGGGRGDMTRGLLILILAALDLMWRLMLVVFCVYVIGEYLTGWVFLGCLAAVVAVVIAVLDSYFGNWR